MKKDLPTYYTDQYGTLRRSVPKLRQSKKERIKQRWEDSERERFPTTGRGNRDVEAENKVKEFLRNHDEGVTACQVANHIGVSQARAARILDNLSIMGEDNNFLIYSDDELDETLYFVHKDDKED